MIGALATLFFAWAAFGLDARELGDLDSEASGAIRLDASYIRANR